MPRKEPQSAVLLSLLAIAAAQSLKAQAPKYEHTITIGSEAGVNPRQWFTGKGGRAAFGRPERLSVFVVPDSVTVDSESRIWITDRGDPSVHMVDLLQGGYKVLRGGTKIPFQEPSGIGAGLLNGNIYVADAALGRVFVFGKDGEFLRFLGGAKAGRIAERPMGIAVSHDLRSIYVTDPPRHRVVVFNQEGETVREWGGLGMPTSISVDAIRDRIYVMDAVSNRIEVFTPGGRRIESLGWPEVPRPTAFAVDPERGWYFVGDERYRMIHIFDQAGRRLNSFGEFGAGANNLHIDSSGRVYVVDSPGSRVLIFQSPLQAVR